MKFPLLILALVLCSGCTVARYAESHPDGTARSVFLVRGGYDTKVGVIDGTVAPAGSTLHIENLDSQAAAIHLATEALKALQVAKP